MRKQRTGLSEKASCAFRLSMKPLAAALALAFLNGRDPQHWSHAHHTNWRQEFAEKWLTFLIRQFLEPAAESTTSMLLGRKMKAGGAMVFLHSIYLSWSVRKLTSCGC